MFNKFKNILGVNLSCICVFLFLQSSIAYSQDEAVLLTVAGEDVSKSEFLAVFHKNSRKDKVIDPKSLEEYVELYINFKLKVSEAKELGLDTTKAFIKELAGYRKQLAAPYLKDKEVNEALLKEAYDRKLKDVRASHILIKVKADPEPSDTLLAYRKIMKIRKRILRGEKFDDVAKLVSEDPSAKDNGGDLGYFSVFQMIYPFESAAYSTEPGNLSKPIRTRYGYHIIKVTDKRDAIGEIKVAHIMVIAKKGIKPEVMAQKKTKIEEAYGKLKAGEKFEDIVSQYSEDKKTSGKGGALPWFSTGKMVGVFDAAAGALKKKGDYSSIIQTEYGFHIIQLLDKKPVPQFDDIKSELKSKISKDSRSNKPTEVFVQKLKKEYKFKQTIREKYDFYKVVDDSYFRGQWKADKATALKSTMFTLAGTKFTQQDFATYIEQHPTKNRKATAKSVVNQLYKRFVQETCIAFEDGRLESKYPEFKALVQEYNDGILLFELTDQKVWSKAIKDTTGLRIFHENNKNNYMWEQRVNASIYTCKDEATAKKVRKTVKKGLKKGYSKDDILKLTNTDGDVLTIEEEKYLKGDNDLIDKITWAVGFSDNQTVEKSAVFVYVKEVLKPMAKTLTEAKGLVTADYQTYLEKEWIEVLKKKFKYSVNKEVLATIK